MDDNVAAERGARQRASPRLGVCDAAIGQRTDVSAVRCTGHDRVAHVKHQHELDHAKREHHHQNTDENELDDGAAAIVNRQ